MTDTEPTASVEPTASTASPTREAIRAELEETRSKYHELLNSLPDEDWNKKSGNPSWRVGQLMWHMAWGLGLFPRGVERCRRGGGFRPPPWITNPANMLITRIGSRGAAPEAVRRKYDANHEAFLVCLDGVQDNEWQRGAMSPFGQYLTVEKMFRMPAEHLEEHKRDIKKGLGRS